MARAPRTTTSNADVRPSGWKAGHRPPALGYGQLDGVYWDSADPGAPQDSHFLGESGAQSEDAYRAYPARADKSDREDHAAHPTTQVDRYAASQDRGPRADPRDPSSFDDGAPY